MCGYLNINSPRNKIHDLREIIHDTPLDYFVISKTKLDDSFPYAQLTMSNYEIRPWRDRDKDSGDLIEFARKGLICRRIGKYESLNIELIGSDVTIPNKNCVILSIYRPPDYYNLLAFSKELGAKYLNQAGENDDIFIVMGNYSIGTRQTSPESHNLDKYCSIFNLRNMIKSGTCFTSQLNNLPFLNKQTKNRY